MGDGLAPARPEVGRARRDVDRARAVVGDARKLAGEQRQEAADEGGRERDDDVGRAAAHESNCSQGLAVRSVVYSDNVSRASERRLPTGQVVTT